VKVGLQKMMDTFTNHTAFQVFMAAIIILNGVYIGVEESFRQEGSTDIVWLFIELIFTLIFVFEFLTKLFAQRCFYFCNGWNLFDFVLVIAGVLGCVIETLSREESGTTAETGTSEARLIRVSRVFKVARLLRLFRLINMMNHLIVKLNKHQMNYTCGHSLRKYTALTAYIKAHLHAQADFVQLLCPAWGVQLAKQNKERKDGEEECTTITRGENGGHIMPVEMANCLIESQAAVYTATVLCVHAVNCVDKETLGQINQVRESVDIAEEMEELILDFQSKGVISGKDADSITHPLHDHIKHCQMLIGKAVQGYDMGQELKEELSQQLVGHDGHHEKNPGNKYDSGPGPTTLPGSTKDEIAFSGIGCPS